MKAGTALRRLVEMTEEEELNGDWSRETANYRCSEYARLIRVVLNEEET